MYSNIQQYIEGQSIADLMWGTANARPVTLTFWVKISITGTFGVVLRSANAGLSYAVSFSYPTANTWQLVTATIPGPTTGVFNRDNTVGFSINWDMGVGPALSISATGAWQSANALGLTSGTKLTQTTGATYQLTGVQLEVGTNLSGFDFRPYPVELMLCQRYFNRMYGLFWSLGIINQAGGSWTLATMTHPTTMRTNPTFGHNLTDAKRVVASPTANQWAVYNQNVGWGSISFSPASTFEGIFNGSGTTTRGHAGGYYTTFTAGSTHIYLGSNVYMEWAAEF
jgi:hypothetical protein